jgi:hypothetical protein
VITKDRSNVSQEKKRLARVIALVAI